MSKIVIIGDLHKKLEEPFFSRNKDFDDWFLSQEFNNENNILIQTGDFFDIYSPNTKVINQSLHFLNGCKFKEIYIISGNQNHAYNRFKGTWAIDAFLGLLKVHIIKEKELLLNIDNTNILLLPWIPDNHFSDKPSMKKYYNNLHYNNIDYIVYHFEDEKYNFNRESSIDISKVVGKNTVRLAGHIHIRNDHYIGTPYRTRKDEKGKESVIAIVNSENKNLEFIKYEDPLDYIDVVYPNELENVDNLKYILLSLDCDGNNEEICKKFYTDKYPNKIYFNNIKNTKLSISTNNDNEESIEEINIEYLFNQFVLESGLDKELASKIWNRIGE